MLTRRELVFRRVQNRVKLKGKEVIHTNEQFEKEKEILPLTIYPKTEVPILKERFQKYTQEFFNIESVNGGLIKLKDGTYVRIFEIKAANFLTLKENEREAILADFGRLLSSGPVNGHFKVLSQHSDLRPYIEYLNEVSNPDTESSKTLLHLTNEISAQLVKLSQNTALDHKYYYVASYKSNLTIPEENEKDALTKMDLYATKVRSTLAKRGIELVFNPDSDNIETLKILFSLYNRNRLRNESFKNRYSRIIQDYGKLVNNNDKPREANFIAPRNFDFTHKDFVLIDGYYYSFLLITGFPDSGIGDGFLNFFTNVGEGFDFDLIYNRELKKDIRERLKKRNIFTKSNADQMGEYSTLLSYTKFLIRSNDALLKALEGDNEFFYFLLICTVSDKSYSKMIKKKAWVKEHFESYNFKIKDPVYEMEEVLNLTDPLKPKDNLVYKKNRRNILTSSFVNFYPFTSATINQKNGVMIGMDKNNLSPIIIDLFNPISNILIIGATGFGKSFLSMLLATRLRLLQTQVYVITPIKGHEYRKICEELGGSFVELGPGSKDSINILEVKPVYKVEVFDENETYFTQNSYLSEKIQDLTSFFNLITGGLNVKTKDLLSPMLLEFYSIYGITEQNNSIYIDSDKTKGIKEMPILSDLRDFLLEQEDQELRDLAIPLKKFTNGNLKNFNHQTNVNLDNKFCVIDLSKAIEYEDTRSLVNFIVQTFVWNRVRTDRKTRKAVLYEEVWKFLDNKETSRTIREVFKTIRGYYGIAIGVTQNLEDLTKNAYNVADGIINNSLVQFLFHSNSDEAEKLQERFKLSASDYGFITGAEQGYVLITTPKQHYEAQVMATETEKKLFETDGNKL